MAARLVTIGDSLTQGFRSGAICDTDWSWPSIVARVLDAPFRQPRFLEAGGLPVNLERLVRGLNEDFGPEISVLEWLPALATLAQPLKQTEQAWERGAATAPQPTGPVHHNLAVWGFEVGDADTLSDALCRGAMPAARWDVLPWRMTPEWPMYRSAMRTLNPSQAVELASLTQVGAARRIAEDEGGIENLVVWLGANHALRTVLSLTVTPSSPDDLGRLAHERSCTLWRPEDFEALLTRLEPRIAGIGAGQVIVGSVPHVTIPPVTRGVSCSAGPERDADGYYEAYTHMWVWDDDFRRRPEKYLSLTRAQAKAIDRTIDAYNGSLRAMAQRRGWLFVDVCAMLDALAFRRAGGQPSYALPPELVAAWRADPQLAGRMAGGLPILDTRYLRGGAAARPPQGGIFSLDGVHPTITGGALIAWEVLKVMEAAGVPGAAPSALPWGAVLAADALVHDTPPNLGALRDLLGLLNAQGFLAALIRRIGGAVEVR